MPSALGSLTDVRLDWMKETFSPFSCQFC